MHKSNHNKIEWISAKSWFSRIWSNPEISLNDSIDSLDIYSKDIFHNVTLFLCKNYKHNMCIIAYCIQNLRFFHQLWKIVAENTRKQFDIHHNNFYISPAYYFLGIQKFLQLLKLTMHWNSFRVADAIQQQPHISIHTIIFTKLLFAFIL